MNENDPLVPQPLIQSLERCKSGIIDTLRAAELHVLQMNQAMEALVGTGNLQQTMLLGDIVYEPRDSNGVSTGRLMQAAIGIGHGGVGVVFWRIDAYQRQIQSAAPQFAPDGVRFSVFRDYPVEVRRLLIPYLSPLIDRLIEITGQ